MIVIVYTDTNMANTNVMGPFFDKAYAKKFAKKMFLGRAYVREMVPPKEIKKHTTSRSLKEQLDF